MHYDERIFRDKLTGLWNRRFAVEHLERVFAQGESVALLWGDVDHMKTFMGYFGIPLGDEALQSLGLLIEAAVEDAGFVCRVGGDEFWVILPACTKESAKRIAAQILANCAPVPIENYPEDREILSLSLGIAHFPDDVANARNLEVAALVALQHAKRGGFWCDGMAFSPRNCALGWGDFRDEFPQQSSIFLRKNRPKTLFRTVPRGFKRDD